jgi:Uma2 family endonuclease
MLARKLEERIYTYADLLRFPESEVWELIDGVPFLHAKPSGKHKYISGQLIRHLLNYLDGKPSDAYQDFPIWPEGKPLNKDAKGYLVPALLVNCDPAKYTEDGLVGPPDLVIEILSPSNAVEAKRDKFVKYQSMGIPEYWIVSPEYRIIDACTLNGGIYHTVCHNKTVLYKEMEIDLNTIFPPMQEEDRTYE